MRQKNRILEIAAISTLLFHFLSCTGMQTISSEKQVLKGSYGIRMSKDELFSHMINWIAENNTKEEQALKSHDRQKGTITCVLSTEIKNFGANVPCDYSLTIRVEPNKYSLTYSNFIGMFGDYQDEPKEIRLKMHYDQIRKKVVQSSKSIKSYLQSKIDELTPVAYLKITKVIQNYVLVDGVGDWQINDNIPVYRKTGKNIIQQVGTIKIVTIKNNMLAGELAKSSIGKVTVGDTIKKFK